jgi:hypothetical protein
MAIKGKSEKEETRIKCPRCSGWMVSEKNYGHNDVFYGWRCIMCGNILDPVILLHRISQDANVVIPETEEGVVCLIKNCMSIKAKEISGKNGADTEREIDRHD